MADSKISALPASTVPLGGTEVLPIVQSGVTKQVSVQNVLSSVQPTGTASGVAYLNGSKVLTTGTALTFDGTTVSLNAGAANFKVGAAGDTSYHYFRNMDNAGSSFYLGIDNSAGSFFNAGAYGRSIYSEGNYPINFVVNSVERMRLDSSGNLGLGVTPSAWVAGSRVLDFAFPFVGMDTNGAGVFGFNAYNSAPGVWRYKSTDEANRFSANTDGTFSWYVAPSGTAGNPITFTQAMTLDASGNLTVASGNIILGTSGKGIDFSATPGTGTSELLADYEEGTWTTTISDTANFTGTPTLSSGKYTKVGRLVTIEGKFAGTVTVANLTSYFKFTLPFSRSATSDGGAGFVFTSSNFQSGGIYNVLADTTTTYLVYAPPALLPSGANTFFFSYSYFA